MRLSDCIVRAISNQKGGVGKTTVCLNLGVGLARQGKKVLLIDFDVQANLTQSMGYQTPDDIPITVSDIMRKMIEDEVFDPLEGVIEHVEGIHLIPSNIQLSGIEASLANTMNRERILKNYVDQIRPHYDTILIDCMPSLGMLTLNALTAANKVIIPIQAHFLSVKGLELLLRTVGRVRKQLNPQLSVEGILINMLDRRATFTMDIIALIREHFGSNMKVFNTEIPLSVRAVEATAEGKSIFQHDPNGKVADAFFRLTKEVNQNERQRPENKDFQLR
jgi:chromosome partitioning protein